MHIISDAVDAELSRLSEMICSHWLPLDARRAAAKRHRQLCRQHVTIERRRFVAPDEKPFEIIPGAPMQELERHRQQAANVRWTESRTEAERLRERILESLADGRTITINDVQDAYGISHDMARKHMIQLVNRHAVVFAGYIVANGVRAHTYRLASAAELLALS